MSFEVYRPETRGEKRAVVSINKNGRLTFNTVAQKLLGDCERVVLLYDREQGLIGVKPAADEEHSVRLRRTPRPKSVRTEVHCMGFFRYYNIPIKSEKRYAKYQNGMLVIPLQKPNADPLRVYKGAA